MSQFSYKYYRHNYSKNETQELKGNAFDDRSWTFWRVWGIYEWLTLLALFAIAVLLFFLLSNSNHTREIVHTSYVTPSEHVLPARVHTVSPVATSAIEQVNEKSSPLKEMEKKSLYHYAKKVLPASPLPVQRVMLNGKAGYGPVSIDEYLYFVRETSIPYPNFIDSKTSNLMVNKAPKCYTSDCVVYGIENLQKEFYAIWISQITGHKFSVVPNRDDIVLTSSNCVE